MLNRRSLRIKVMQYLYALERQKEAFQLMAREQSGSHFDPDLNANEPQDLKALDASKQEVYAGFENSFVSGVVSGDCAPDIKEAIEDGLAAYQQLIDEAKKLGLKQLKEEAKTVSQSYFKILTLPITWSELIVQEWNRLVADEKPVGTGYRNLANNPLISAIQDNTALTAQLKKNKLGWDTEAVSEWLRKIVMKDETYDKYSTTDGPSIEDHIEMVNHLFKKVIFKNEVIEGYMEEHDLGWAENRGIIKSMVVKTLKTFSEDRGNIELINLSPNWEEDEEFYQKLYKETVEGDAELEKIIGDKSKNWEKERIAAVDMVLMKMAITEFLKFPSIPVKVTINEYIEICKTYSTPKSKQYVNGILDVLSSEMTKDGSIKKSGRGLLDNK